MDLNGGAFNLSSIELLCRLKTKGQKYFHGAMLPSAGDIWRVFLLVEEIGKVRIPFKMKQFPSGEGLEFEMDKLVMEVMRAFKFDTVATTQSISIAQTQDGLNLTKKLNHSMGGFKVNDPAAVDPLTEALMFAGTTKGDKTMMSIHSRNNCFPMMHILGQENAAMYKNFELMYCFFQQAGRIGIDGWKPFKVTTEVDMSAIWKMLGHGGAAKCKKNPWHCCGATSTALAHPNPTLCHCCCFNRPEGWKCYHHRIVTDEILEEKKKELDELKDTLAGVIDKAKDSQLTFKHPTIPQDGALQDPMSIHFQPANASERQLFSDLLNRELQLRRKEMRGRLSEQQRALPTDLTTEYHHKMVAEEVNACRRPEDVLFLLMQCIPCVLHMENRVGLKIIQMVSQEGLSSVNKGVLLQGYPGGLVGKTRFMIQAVEATINQCILGSHDNPAQWKFPYDKTEKKLTPITLVNKKTRKVVDKLELLIEVLVEDGIEKEKWNSCLCEYRQAMKLLQHHHNFTNEDIYKCQDAIDDFFQDWISLHCLDGVTNHIHLLSSGHIAEYLFRHCNLYRHSLSKAGKPLMPC